jgi:general stress protein 26
VNIFLKLNGNVMKTKSLLFILILYFVSPLSAQSKSANNPDTLLTSAREIIMNAGYCGLSTNGADGYPHIRTMDAFAPDENMVVWFGTNPLSRKVSEIKNDPHVSIYYADQQGTGYAVISGIAEIVNDKAEKQKHWKEEWTRFYPDRDKSYTLIRVQPVRIDFINYKRGIIGDPKTWKAEAIYFNK